MVVPILFNGQTFRLPSSDNKYPASWSKAAFPYPVYTDKTVESAFPLPASCYIIPIVASGRFEGTGRRI